ncbi:epoxide hydrolase N-terminal domain-containing protein [Streptomyces sp. NPDC006649]|uniref:epoxide hydrolase N-terminal domain-containing protein n=1 Tax=Streptomyces sp. NPDC006649 TaxID=3156896 RepID=UPI0033B0C4E5
MSCAGVLRALDLRAPSPAAEEAIYDSIDDDQMEDLDRRLRHTRRPDAMPDMYGEDGTDLTFLRRLTEYWRTEFDWRAQEARLNAFPQFVAELDGVGIHFSHQRGTGPAPYPYDPQREGELWEAAERFTAAHAAGADTFSGDAESGSPRWIEQRPNGSRRRPAIALPA